MEFLGHFQIKIRRVFGPVFFSLLRLAGLLYLFNLFCVNLVLMFYKNEYLFRIEELLGHFQIKIRLGYIFRWNFLGHFQMKRYAEFLNHFQAKRYAEFLGHFQIKRYAEFLSHFQIKMREVFGLFFFSLLRIAELLYLSNLFCVNLVLMFYNKYLFQIE